MSISERLKLLLRSEINAFKGGSLKELKETKKELSIEFSKLRRQEENLIVEIRRHRDEAEMWEQRASLALKRNQEELARSALKEQNRKQESLKSLKEELRETRDYLSRISSAIGRLREDAYPETYDFHKDTSLGEESSFGLSGRSDPQDADSWAHRHLRRPHKQSHPLHLDDTDHFSPSHTHTFDEFDRISDRLDANTAAIEAENELNASLHSNIPSPDPLIDPEGAKFEEEYKKIEREQQLKRELDALKSRFKD